MTQKFSDNGRALLAASILSTDTSLTVESAKADRFPVATTVSWASVLDWFKCVLIDSSGNREVIKVGTRTLGSGVFGNVLRAQDGTTALAFTAGSLAICPITAADIEDALLAKAQLDDYKTAHPEGAWVQVGDILMTKGSLTDIAARAPYWQLCDGTNGTPDLRDKFVVGAGSAYAPAATGGSKDAVAIAHAHTATSTFTGTAMGTHGHPTVDNGHAHNVQGSGGGGSTTGVQGTNGGGPLGGVVTDTQPAGITVTAVSAGTPAGSVATTVASAGAAGTNLNLPPYYALAFICRML